MFMQCQVGWSVCNLAGWFYDHQGSLDVARRPEPVHGKKEFLGMVVHLTTAVFCTCRYESDK